MIDAWLEAGVLSRSSVTVLVFVLGACVGSFLNVCITCIPRQTSIVGGHTHCPACTRMIPWYLSVPILGYVLLAGRCKYCRGRISPRYLIVELLAAFLFTLVWVKYTSRDVGAPLGLAAVPDWRFVPVYWLVVSGLLLGTFVDLEHLIIPERVTIGGIVAGLASSALVPGLHGSTDAGSALVSAAVAAGAGGGGLWLLAAVGRMVFRKEAIGLGDVKLLAGLGAFLGLRAVLFIVLVSSLCASLVGMSAGRWKRLEGRIPYGPYLALAAVVWMLWGDAFWLPGLLP